MLTHDWESESYVHEEGGKRFMDVQCRACGGLRTKTGTNICGARTKAVHNSPASILGEPYLQRKFAHEPLLSQEQGKIKVYCRCGAQSVPLENLETAQEVYKLHVGLKEMEQKQLLH